jgi:iron complex transport system substrate-binding protein
MALIASQCTCSAVSEDQNGENFTLDIFGNANMDANIDENDIAYVEGIIKGTNAATNLSDANYDGKIDAQDIDRIKEIMGGKEEELTLIDTANRTITIKKPITRIVSYNIGFLETIRSLKLDKGKIVGIEGWSKQNKVFFPEFNELPDVGTINPFTFNCEEVLELQPDIVVLYGKTFPSEREDIIKKFQETNSKIVVLCMECQLPAIYAKEVKMLGYILDKRDEANDFTKFYCGVLNVIKENIKDIPGDKRPRIYLEHTNKYQVHCGESVYSERLEEAGGKNIFGGVSANIQDMDPERVLTYNPEVIVKVSWPTGGYDTNNITLLSSIRDEILNRSEFANIPALKNRRVYVFNRYIASGAASFIGSAYMAKWFYPELFKNLDPKAIHQEYLTRFQGLNYDLDKEGVFVYPSFSKN